MNYTEDTAKKYKDELMRIYRSNNPQGNPNATAKPAQDAQAQNALAARQPQYMHGKAAEPVPMPPDVSLPPRKSAQDAMPAQSVQSAAQREADNTEAESYPFLLPDRKQAMQKATEKSSASVKKLEYTDNLPAVGDRFAAPPSRPQAAKRRTPAQTKKNGTVRNINGNTNNSYNDSRAEARSAPVAEPKPALEPVRNADVSRTVADAVRKNGTEPSGSQSGLLMVEVSTAGGAVPLEGAFVTVTRQTDSGVALVSMLTSDISGRTRTIELPAPDRSQSLSPDGGSRGKPFSTYTIRADKEGFYSVINVDVPVFSGVKSIQPVEMIPLPEYTPIPSPIEYLSEEPDLRK